jgi:HEAT repeat protein
MTLADPLDVLYDSKSEIQKRRYAVSTLGKTRDECAVESLIQLVQQDPNLYVRHDAAYALGEIGDPAAVDALIASLGLEGYPQVRRAISQALGKIKDTRAARILICTLEQDRFYTVRQAAAEALGKLNDPIAIKPLVDALKDVHSSVRWNATLALSHLGRQYPEVAEHLVVILTSPSRSTETALQMMMMLEKMNLPLVVHALIDVLNEGTSRVKPLGFLDPRGKSIYAERQRSDAQVRIAAAIALGKFGDKRAIEPLLQRLNDPNEDPSLRPYVVKALGQLGEET